MASIGQTDTRHRRYYNVGCPNSSRFRCRSRKPSTLSDRWRVAVPLKERNVQRYSRHVFLASSFDRWRKLRSSLKLRDSSLAWHLMEAHDEPRGCVTCCGKYGEDECHDSKAELLKSSLLMCVQKFFESEDYIKVVGSLYIDCGADKVKKVTMNTVLKSMTRLDNTFGSVDGENKILSSDVHNDHAKTDFALSSEPSSNPTDPQSINPVYPSSAGTTKLEPVNESPTLSDYGATAPKDDKVINENSMLNASACSMESNVSVEIDIVGMDSSQEMEKSDVGANCVELPSKEVHLSYSTDQTGVNSIECVTENTAFPTGNDRVNVHTVSHYEDNASLEAGVVKQTEVHYKNISDNCSKQFHLQNERNGPIVQPQETDSENLNCNYDSRNVSLLPENILSNNSHNPYSETYHTLDNQQETDLDPSAVNTLNMSVMHQQAHGGFYERETENMSVSKEGVMEKCMPEKPTFGKRRAEVVSPEDADKDGSGMPFKLPRSLDDHSLAADKFQNLHDSNLKPIVRHSEHSHSFNNLQQKVSSHNCDETSAFSQKNEASSTLKECDRSTSQDKHTSLPTPNHSAGSPASSSSIIPWQRRDMSRKEEYEFLETHPFCDLAEFSACYPHVHQRTYYRWKRRIKEEFMILEQCPDMTFAQFSAVVLQAKENVFSLWKSLVAQGKGFDSSKRMESKLSAPIPQSVSEEQKYLQKNLAATFLDFSQRFPGGSLAVFNTLKQKSLQEFSIVHQNPQMSYKEISKLVDISEEIFTDWRRQSLSPLSHPQAVSPHRNGIHKKFPLVHSPPFMPNSNESMAQSLSASYLASLQSLMFPWPSNYYGLSPPQPMLPFMLWPGMMGSGAFLSHLQSANPAAIMAASATSSALVEEPHKSSISSTAPSKDIVEQLPSGSKGEVYSQNVLKVPSSDKLRFYKEREEMKAQVPEKLQMPAQDKSEESSRFRSRKQNLQEYVYYLHKPELAFKELETLFPSISSRTFYRWRKEINSALLMLGENPNVDFENFKIVFPDIPKDIFDMWQSKAKKGESFLPCVNESVLADQVPAVNASNSCWRSSPALSSHSDDGSRSQRSGTPASYSDEDYAQQKKCHKEEYLYVQRNPNVDFSSFSRLFPNTSVRTFYRWKKELRDAIEFLRCNPCVGYEEYRTIDATISLEVFNIWKFVVKNKFAVDDSNEENVLDENFNSALSYIHKNPSISYNHFVQLFPGVKEHVFEKWQEETNQLVRYVQDNPNVEFSVIQSLVPHVSFDSFTKWKEMTPSTSSNMFTDSTVEHTKTEMTKAFVYLMYNPTISFLRYKSIFEFVSPTTFELWLNRIRSLIVDITSNPSIRYEEFNIKDMSKDLFDKLRSLGPHDLALMDDSCNEARLAQVNGSRTASPEKYNKSSSHSSEDNLAQPDVKRSPTPDRYRSSDRHIAEKYDIEKPDSAVTENQAAVLTPNLRAYLYLQYHPTLLWEDFHYLYPDVPKEVFQSSVDSIHEQMKYVKSNHYLTYCEFKQVFPYTSEEVFDFWKFGVSSDKKNKSYSMVGKAASEVKPKEHSFRPIEKGPHNKLEDQTVHESSNDNYSYDRANNNASKNDDMSITTSGLSSKVIKEEPFSSQSNSVHFPNHGLHSNQQLLGVPTISHSPYIDNKNNEPSHGTSSSLSALISLTSGNPNKESPHAVNTATDLHTSNTLSPCSSQKAQSLTPPHNPGSREYDDEAFSSQRQKKMSRAEYMFVKANPDVDSQEFSRIFPGVSARTFYRWKKEIRSQLQMS